MNFPQGIGVLQLVLGVVSLAFLRPTIGKSNKPGTRSFQLLCVAIAIYAFWSGIDLFVADRTISIWTYNVQLLGGILIGVAWLLLALSITERIRVTRPLIVGLAGYTAISQLLVWSNPIHHLVLEPTTTVNTVNNLVVVQGSAFWGLLGGTYLFVLGGTALLAIEARYSTGIRRKQMATLSLGLLPTLLGSIGVVFFVDVFQYDTTVFGYVGTAAIFGAALFDSRFLDIEPIARRVAMEEMSDAMVALDSRNRVVDCNQSAKRLFGIDGEYVGMDAVDFAANIPPQTQTQFVDVVDDEVEISFKIHGRQRWFSVSVSPIGERGKSGRVLVFHDITEQRRYEQELEETTRKLELLNRIIRHDINNDMTVIIGRSEYLLEELNDELAQENLESIIKQGDHVAELTETLHNLMEAILNESNTTKPTDLDTVLNREIESVRTIDDSVTVHTPADPLGEPVQADEALATVFRNLLTNAVRHNDTKQPTIWISTTDAGTEVIIRISDNGPGVPEQSRDVIFGRNEKGLDSSGTGIGLYLVETLVSGYGGAVWVETSEHGGATFAIRLQKANPTSHGFSPTES